MVEVRAIKGVYRHGKVELTEQPDLPEGTQVVVAVPVDVPPPPRQMMTFGMLRTEGGRESTLEDFAEAEYRPKPEDLDVE